MMRFIGIFIFLIVATSCRAQSSDIYVEPNQVTDPKEAYRKGFYRRAAELFEANPALADTLENRYLWASSYYELRRYEDAFAQYNKINYKAFADDKTTKFLYPFFVQKYFDTMLSLDTSLFSEEQNINLIEVAALVPRDSPIRETIDSWLFNLLWNLKKYDEMNLFQKNISDQGEAWLELAKYAQAKPYNLNKILTDHKSLGTAYSNLVTEIIPSDISSPNQLKALTEMGLELKLDKTLDFAQRYADATQDQEYYLIMNSALLQKNTKATEGALVLYSYLTNNPRSSQDFYKTTHQQLVRRKQFDQANEIALLAQRYHKLDFYMDLPSSIEYTKDADRALAWYQSNYRKLSPQAHDQILRSLVRLDLKKAESLAEIGLPVNGDNPNFILKYALIKQSLGDTEEAYKNYVNLLFKDPFGYAGVVARRKEQLLRSQYKPIIDQAVSIIVKEMPRYNLQDRLMTAKALLIDKDYADLVDIKQVEKDQKAFNRIVLADLAKVPLIRELEKIDRNITNYSVETEMLVSKYVANALDDSKDWHDTARLFYKYRDLFIDSDMIGYLTFRLYFYVRDQYGYTYFPNYPKEVLDLIFPKPMFEIIKKYSNNDTDLAYWMLSSFMAESHFRKRVFSRVGAVGFAQVMPYTAVDIKRWMRKPEYTNYDFYDNLRMGIYYHYKMYEDMDKNIILSLAAYNAGPNAVKRWRREYSFITDQDLFVEAIPYEETRNYVRIIAYNYEMYRLINQYQNQLYPQ